MKGQEALDKLAFKLPVAKMTPYVVIAFMLLVVVLMCFSASYRIAVVAGVIWLVVLSPPIRSHRSAPEVVRQQCAHASSKGHGRFLISDYDFRFQILFPTRDSRAVPGTRAVRPVVPVEAVRQHRRNPVWRNPCGDRRDRLCARFHPPLSGHSKCAIAIFNSSSH